MWTLPLLWHHAHTGYNTKACYGGLTGLEILIFILSWQYEPSGTLI